MSAGSGPGSPPSFPMVAGSWGTWVSRQGGAISPKTHHPGPGVGPARGETGRRASRRVGSALRLREMGRVVQSPVRPGSPGQPANPGPPASGWCPSLFCSSPDELVIRGGTLVLRNLHARRRSERRPVAITDEQTVGCVAMPGWRFVVARNVVGQFFHTGVGCAGRSSTRITRTSMTLV